jgi:hypothetical protein
MRYRQSLVCWPHKQVAAISPDWVQTGEIRLPNVGFHRSAVFHKPRQGWLAARRDHSKLLSKGRRASAWPRRPAVPACPPRTGPPSTGRATPSAASDPPPTRRRRASRSRTCASYEEVLITDIRRTAGLCSLSWCLCWQERWVSCCGPHNPPGRGYRPSESSQLSRDESWVQSGKVSGVSGS